MIGNSALESVPPGGNSDIGERYRSTVKGRTNRCEKVLARLCRIKERYPGGPRQTRHSGQVQRDSRPRGAGQGGHVEAERAPHGEIGAAGVASLIVSANSAEPARPSSAAHHAIVDHGPRSVLRIGSPFVLVHSTPLFLNISKSVAVRDSSRYAACLLRGAPWARANSDAVLEADATMGLCWDALSVLAGERPYRS